MSVSGRVPLASWWKKYEHAMSWISNPIDILGTPWRRQLLQIPVKFFVGYNLQLSPYLLVRFIACLSSRCSGQPTWETPFILLQQSYDVGWLEKEWMAQFHLVIFGGCQSERWQMWHCNPVPAYCFCICIDTAHTCKKRVGLGHMTTPTILQILTCPSPLVYVTIF